MFHVVCVGWLIAMAFGSRLTRILLGAITAIIVIGVGIVTYGVYSPLENYDIVMEINRWTVRVSALIVAGFVVWEFVRPRKEEVASPPLNRLVGVLTILAWFTVAAAGRWIGLGTS
jgi:cytochrome c oxidase assembly factor CtaG